LSWSPAPPEKARAPPFLASPCACALSLAREPARLALRPRLCRTRQRERRLRAYGKLAPSVRGAFGCQSVVVVRRSPLSAVPLAAGMAGVAAGGRKDGNRIVR
jgi:hypothetical protein